MLSVCAVIRLFIISTVISFVAISRNCSAQFCEEKKSRKLIDFDGTRRNLISCATSTSCAINYFDVESISELTLNVIRNAKSIRILDLRGNRISTIHNDTFNLFSALEILKLGDNFLVEIRSHYFNGLKELSILDLSSNLIQSVEENSFVKLSTLLGINLADNCIINLTLNLPIVALDSLNLSRNLIANFPHFKNKLTIDSLDLSRNTNGVLNFTVDAKFSPLERDKIVKFSTPIVRSIRILNVADNELTDLMQLESFSNLARLNIADNPIDYHAKILPYFKEMKSLNVSSTNLTSIDHISYIVDISQLTTLSIDRNLIEVEDLDSMVKFNNLQHLQYSANFCYDFESYRGLRENFQHLTHITIHYSTPDCKCAEENKKFFSLYHIKFSTDWQHVCSSSGQRFGMEMQLPLSRLIHAIALIVLQALTQLQIKFSCF